MLTNDCEIRYCPSLGPFELVKLSHIMPHFHGATTILIAGPLFSSPFRVVPAALGDKTDA